MKPILSSGDFSPLSEIALQKKVVGVLTSEAERWRTVPVTNSSSDARTLFDLIGKREFGRDFDLKEEQCLLPKGNSILSVDLFGFEKPDLVLWSKRSGQHRIVFEVKQHAKATHKEPDGSQFLRYFLHLLVTSDAKPKGKADVRRGVIVVAPSAWFKTNSKSNAWRYLSERYGPLAEKFDITFGELRAEDF